MARPAEPAELPAIVTNSSPASPGRAYAVLLDDVWIPELDRPSVRDAVATFLTRSVGYGDQVRLASSRRAMPVERARPRRA